jgi:hypothetical protein
MATTEGESIMGYVEVWNAHGDGGWTRLEDVEMIDTIPCQLCNEPTLASDIIIPAVIKDGVLTAWQHGSAASVKQLMASHPSIESTEASAQSA